MNVVSAVWSLKLIKLLPIHLIHVHVNVGRHLIWYLIGIYPICLNLDRLASDCHFFHQFKANIRVDKRVEKDISLVFIFGDHQFVQLAKSYEYPA